MSRKYPNSSSVHIKNNYGAKCPECQQPTPYAIKTITQISWFRGDDVVELRILCPNCNNWKTMCKECGKVLKSQVGLYNHLKDKHDIE